VQFLSDLTKKEKHKCKKFPRCGLVNIFRSLYSQKMQKF